MMISFKGAQFPKDVILFAVFFYRAVHGVAPGSWRDHGRTGVQVDHATLNRWVAKYSPRIANTARRRKVPADRSWRMDETYIKEVANMIRKVQVTPALCLFAQFAALAA
jgi:putative transposase